MKRAIFLIVVSVLFQSGLTMTLAQNKSQTPSEQDFEKANKAFIAGNELMEKGKPAEALARYKEALSLLPDEPSVLFNTGLAAYLAKDYATALDLWKKLKSSDPQDWNLKTKLIQCYQAMGKQAERDAERAELFQMRKSGKIEELSQQESYCRDQFEANKMKVMVFEHFELKGERALRYVFSVLNKAGNDEEFRISLGSYETTNAVWRLATKPKPKEGERLFHLDGYFESGSHATYWMYAPEPSYDEVRSRVIKILEAYKPESKN